METNKNIVDFMKPRERESISDNYLNGLVSNVMATVQQQETVKIIPFYKKTVFWLSNVAAVIVLVILIQFNRQSTTVVCDFDSVSETELLAYVEDNIEDFDQELLMHYVSLKKENVFMDEKMDKPENVSSDVSKTHTELTKESKFDKNQFNEINKEDILDYLEEEELNYDDLQESQDLF